MAGLLGNGLFSTAVLTEDRRFGGFDADGERAKFDTLYLVDTNTANTSCFPMAADRRHRTLLAPGTVIDTPDSPRAVEAPRSSDGAGHLCPTDPLDPQRPTGAGERWHGAKPALVQSGALGPDPARPRFEHLGATPNNRWPQEAVADRFSDPDICPGRIVGSTAPRSSYVR